MNFFNFNNKQSCVDFVQSLSNEDIILQRKLISNPSDDLKFRYHDVKPNIELTIVPTLKTIVRKRNISEGNQYFKKALQDFFNMYSCDREYFKIWRIILTLFATILGFAGTSLSELLKIYAIK